MEPIIILVLAGILGGLVRSFLGFENQSQPVEKFNKIKLLKSLIRGGAAGGVMAMIESQTGIIEPSTTLYITTFFVSMGADVLMKETYTVTKKISNGTLK